MAIEDIKAKSFFQIPPSEDNTNRVVLCNQGFCLDDVHLITEVAMVCKLQYVFYVHIGYSSEYKLEFVFERKIEALSCQRELTRAWAGVGEYNFNEV